MPPCIELKHVHVEVSNQLTTLAVTYNKDTQTVQIYYKLLQLSISTYDVVGKGKRSRQCDEGRSVRKGRGNGRGNGRGKGEGGGHNRPNKHLPLSNDYPNKYEKYDPNKNIPTSINHPMTEVKDETQNALEVKAETQTTHPGGNGQYPFRTGCSSNYPPKGGGKTITRPTVEEIANTRPIVEIMVNICVTVEVIINIRLTVEVMAKPHPTVEEMVITHLTLMTPPWGGVDIYRCCFLLLTVRSRSNGQYPNNLEGKDQHPNHPEDSGQDTNLPEESDSPPNPSGGYGQYLEHPMTNNQNPSFVDNYQCCNPNAP